MSILSPPMKRLIENYSAGSVATVNDDGTPAVSPKATFMIVDDATVAFGNIRSPATLANLRLRPDVEVNFIDVLTRRAVRIRGRAEIVEKESEMGRKLMPLFEQKWASFLDALENFVCISVSHAELILSPAYDIGQSAAELRRTNLDKLNKLS
jgi:general stress protein 26